MAGRRRPRRLAVRRRSRRSRGVRSRWHDLAQLQGDQGAGRLLRTEDVVAVDWAGGAVDIDTEDDVVALTERARTAAASPA